MVQIDALLQKARDLFLRFDLYWYCGITFACSALVSCLQGSYEDAKDFWAEASFSARKLCSPYEELAVDYISGTIRAMFPKSPALAAAFRTSLPLSPEEYRSSVLQKAAELGISVEKHIP